MKDIGKNSKYYIILVKKESWNVVTAIKSKKGMI